jgi:hypothetical protein
LGDRNRKEFSESREVALAESGGFRHDQKIRPVTGHIGGGPGSTTPFIHERRGVET